MNDDSINSLDKLIDGLGEGPGSLEPAAAEAQRAAPAGAAPRNLTGMMRKIRVTMTLEVGSAQITLQDLLGMGTDSVVELDTLAGEPLTIRVNGTPIGRAEVVVAGDNYGLKVVELADFDLDTLSL